MKPIVALPFTEMTVMLMDDDPTCLIRIGGRKMRIVGRKSIARGTVHFIGENGWECKNPPVIPIIEVEEKET